MNTNVRMAVFAGLTGKHEFDEEGYVPEASELEVTSVFLRQDGAFIELTVVHSGHVAHHDSNVCGSVAEAEHAFVGTFFDLKGKDGLHLIATMGEPPTFTDHMDPRQMLDALMEMIQHSRDDERPAPRGDMSGAGYGMYL